MKLSNQPINRRYIFIVVIFAIAAGWLIIYQNTFEFPESEGMRVIAKKRGTTLDQEASELIRTESVICDNKIYIFDTVLIREKYNYFNDIYKTTRSPENFVVRLKAPTTNLDAFFVLAVPKKDCDRIYLTTARYETSRPIQGIFEWEIDKKIATELTISKNFWGSFLPSHPGDYWRDAVSPDGEKILVAHPYDLQINGWSCDIRVLKIFFLRKDASKDLVQLLGKEALSAGSYADEEGYCRGLKFGWLDESSIYFDVYHVTVEEISFFEERTLLIK